MEKYIVKLKALFKDGFFHILVGGTLTKIIAFFSSIIIVRLIAKDEYAFLAYADNIYSYIHLICGFGAASALLKFATSEDKGKNKAYYVFAMKFGTITQILISVLLFAILSIIPLAFPESEKYIYALLLYPFFYFWIGLIQSFMRTQFKNREFAYAGIMQTGVVLIGSVSFVLIWGVYGVIGARYLASIIVVLYCLKSVKKELSCKETHLTNEERKSFVSLSIALLTANIFSMIMPINESFLINNIICDEVTTANYKVASLIPAQLPFITSTIITYYFPIFARIENKDKEWALAKNVGKITFVAVSAVTIVGIIVSPVIIKIFYGEQYSDIGGLMTLLWIMYSVNAGFRMLPMNILPAIGYAKFNVVMSVISCIVHFIIDVVCISLLGINGAVIAGGIVYLSSGCAYWIYLRKKTGGYNV